MVGVTFEEVATENTPKGLKTVACSLGTLIPLENHFSTLMQLHSIAQSLLL